MYLPEGCAADEEHRELAGVPEEVLFATKPQLASGLLDRAQSLGIRAAFVAGDTRCAEVPVRQRTGRATPKWLVRALPADCGAGPHDGTPQENSGQVSKLPGTEEP